MGLSIIHDGKRLHNQLRLLLPSDREGTYPSEAAPKSTWMPWYSHTSVMGPVITDPSSKLLKGTCRLTCTWADFEKAVPLRPGSKLLPSSLPWWAAHNKKCKWAGHSMISDRLTQKHASLSTQASWRAHRDRTQHISPEASKAKATCAATTHPTLDFCF